MTGSVTKWMSLVSLSFLLFVTFVNGQDKGEDTLSQYKEYMAKWVERQVQTIDNKISPQKWQDALELPMGSTTSTPDSQTLAHLRALHQTRNRLTLIHKLFSTSHVETLNDQLQELNTPGAITLMGTKAPNCCLNVKDIENVGKPECTKEICEAFLTQYSERLMSDLNAAETFIAHQQTTQKDARATSLLSDRIFMQAESHADRSAKPILPGVNEIGQGYFLPRGKTNAEYFEINTLNIERNSASSELSNTWSVPGAINVIPIHEYNEFRVEVYSNMQEYTKVQQQRLGIVTGRGVLLHGRDSEHLQATFNRAQVLVEVRLSVVSYRITMAENAFEQSKVGTRDELRSSHRREAIEVSSILPDGENLLNKGMNKDSSVLQNSNEEMSIRTSFCPTSKLWSQYPRAPYLTDCVVTQRSLTFFKHFPSILGRLNGMHRSFYEEVKRRTIEDGTKECDDSDLQNYFWFLAEYGSHFVSSVDMGCSVTWTHTVERKASNKFLATLQSMSRMERCTSETSSSVSEESMTSENVERNMEEEQREMDASMGQAVEDALGPTRVQRTTGEKKKDSPKNSNIPAKKKNRKNKNIKKKTKVTPKSSRDENLLEKEDDKDIVVEDYDDDKNDEKEADDDTAGESESDKESSGGEDSDETRRRRRRRLLGREKDTTKEEEEEDDLACHSFQDKTLVDLGVVNPSLKFVGGDLTLAPKSIKSIKDARLEPYLASCMDRPASIGQRLSEATRALLMRPKFTEGCAFDHTLYMVATKQCTELLDKMDEAENAKRRCYGISGRANCLAQCTNNFNLFFQECKEMGKEMTMRNRLQAESRVTKSDRSKDNQINFETVDGIKECRRLDLVEQKDERLWGKTLHLEEFNGVSEKKNNEQNKEQDDKMLDEIFFGIAGPTFDRSKIYDVLDNMDQSIKYGHHIPVTKKEISKYSGGRALLRKVSVSFFLYLFVFSFSFSCLLFASLFCF